MPASFRRHVTGRGEERGRIVLQLDLLASAGSGSGGGQGARLCIFQLVPWWAQLWLHTLHLTYDGQVLRKRLQSFLWYSNTPWCAVQQRLLGSVLKLVPLASTEL